MALNNLYSYNFPDSYATLISSYSGTVKYISSTGSNSNNGNSVTSPYLTVDYAYTQTTATTNVMFVILAGTYTMTAVSATQDVSVAIRDEGKQRVYVGCPGQTIIQWTATTANRDCSMVDFSNTGSAIYGVILKRNNNGRTGNYPTAYFRSYGGATKGNFYNCVFQETNANNNWSYQYDNYGGANFAVRNCTIYNNAAAIGNYTNAGTCLTIDTVFNTTCTTGGTETNVLKSQTVNGTTYVTSGVTTAGVYSGTYAWNGTITPPSPGLYTSSNTAVTGSAFTVSLVTTGVSNGTLVPYTITGVTSGQISGASLTGNFTISSDQATVSFTPTIYTPVNPVFSLASNGYTANVTLGPYVSISVPTVLQTIYATSVIPISGQMNINHMGANAISDPTLQPAVATKTIPSNSYLQNKVIVPTVTTTTKLNSQLTVYVTKPMGNDLSRELWM